jgi:hypothetical protein
MSFTTSHYLFSPSRFLPHYRRKSKFTDLCLKSCVILWAEKPKKFWMRDNRVALSHLKYCSQSRYVMLYCTVLYCTVIYNVPCVCPCVMLFVQWYVLLYVRPLNCTHIIMYVASLPFTCTLPLPLLLLSPHL